VAAGEVADAVEDVGHGDSFDGGSCWMRTVLCWG
jgi:hypothetical protein